MTAIADGSYLIRINSRRWPPPHGCGCNRIAVRTDWKGRGVGYLLMNRLMDIVRQCGIGELVGEVLRENGPMLQMCLALGFTVAPDPDEAAVLRVRKGFACE